MKTLTSYMKEHFEQLQKPLLEMARLDDPKSPVIPNYEIWVYGNDRSTMSPHFHILNKVEHLNLEVRITDLEVIKSTPRKGIPKNKLASWEGLSFLKKALTTWLSKNDKLTNVNNYVLLIAAWNTNNRDGQQLSITDCLKLS